MLSDINSVGLYASDIKADKRCRLDRISSATTAACLNHGSATHLLMDKSGQQTTTRYIDKQ